MTKKFEEVMIEIIALVEKCLSIFFKVMNFFFISHPQYLLFIIELAFLGLMIWFNGIFTLWNIYLVIGLIIGAFKLNYLKSIDYGGILEQLNDTEGKGKSIIKSTPKYYNRYPWYFFILFFFYGYQLTISDDIVNILGFFFSLFIYICEALICSTALSPFLFILLIFGFSTIVVSIGSESTILNWTFLLLFFGTTIGSNFFDKSLVKGRFSKKITDDNLILRKISYFIGLIFLYLGITFSESILKSTYYYVHFIGENTSGISFFQNLVVKCSIFFLLFSVYLGTEKKIMYLIFRFYYRDKTLKNSNSLVKVYLYKEKRWKVKGVKKKPKDIERIGINTYTLKKHYGKIPSSYQVKTKKNNNSVVKVSLYEEKRWKVKRVKKKPRDVERIGIDTYTLKKHNVIYVDKNSEIPEKIKGLREAEGKRILGLVPLSTKILLLLTIAILPVIYSLDKKVKADNGTYSICINSDNIDISDTIEVSGDTIIYNGKAEKFDTRKQSFSMGKIKKNDSNNITIKFYENGEDVHYTKLNSSGIPYKLKEKYSGYSKEPGSDKSIFSSGSSTLIFNINENKINNKTKSHHKSFVVIPKDRLDGKAKDNFNKLRSKYKGYYFIFKLNTKYNKNSSNIYVAILSDGGKEIKINELDSSAKDDNHVYNFTGKAE